MVFKPRKNGAPHAPTARMPPKRITASMLSRPALDQ
jgi:hypothetical protein